MVNHDFFTHREAWRAALVAACNAADLRGDRSDCLYWEHEIATFDRAFESLTPPAVGSIWRHRNGNLYRVEEIGNAESVADGRADKYPPTVWYRNTANNKPYNRRVDDWHRSMTLVSEPVVMRLSKIDRQQVARHIDKLDAINEGWMECAGQYSMEGNEQGDRSMTAVANVFRQAANRLTAILRATADVEKDTA